MTGVLRSPLVVATMSLVIALVLCGATLSTNGSVSILLVGGGVVLVCTVVAAGLVGLLRADAARMVDRELARIDDDDGRGGGDHEASTHRRRS